MLPMSAYADRGPATTTNYYDRIWMGRSAAYESVINGRECGQYYTWTKVTNVDVDKYWLRNRTKAWSGGQLRNQQVVENTTTFHSAGDAIENYLIWYASKNEYRQTYSSHALYKDSPFNAATTSAFDTYADEDSKY